MDTLKKIKSATLVEALVATVLIVVIFIISSLAINNLLINTFNNNTSDIENRFYELEYNQQNSKIEVPYNEEYNDWEISINKNSESENNNVLEYKAIKKGSAKTIIKIRIDEK